MGQLADDYLQARKQTNECKEGHPLLQVQEAGSHRQGVHVEGVQSRLVVCGVYHPNLEVWGLHHLQLEELMRSSKDLSKIECYNCRPLNLEAPKIVRPV